MNALRVLSVLSAFLLINQPSQSYAQTEPIIVISAGDPQSAIRAYDKNGNSSYQITLNNDQMKRVLTGRWSDQSSAAAMSGEVKNRVIRFFNNNGSVSSEALLTNEPINTFFAADFNNNGYSDLILIVHNGTKAKAIVYYDPGLSTSAPVSFGLPSQSLYYAPAIAGKTTVGILAYNPQAAKASARVKRGRKKIKKPKKSKSGLVTLIDTAGNAVKSFKMSKPIDGQIFPFSPDGTCGFAIQVGAKLKTYNSNGTLFRDISLLSESPAVLGDYTSGTTFAEVVTPYSQGVNILNILTGALTFVELKDLPNMQEHIQSEVERLNDLLLQAYLNNKSIEEIDKIREELAELNTRQNNIGNATNVAGRIVRLFTGGAGAIEGVCDTVDEIPNDGYGGFLIKNGDFTNKIVVLTPGGKNYTGAELLKFGSYKPFQKLKESGWGNPDSSGLRKHFRGNGTVQSLGKFIFRAKITSDYVSGKIEKHCWYITKPAARID